MTFIIEGFIDANAIDESLYREIKDIKSCKTCKHWMKKPEEICEVWRNTEEISEGENKSVLDCWERKS